MKKVTKPKKDYFVANSDGTFYCGDCIPKEIDVGDPNVDVWNYYEGGWLKPCVCKECSLSIPIYVDLMDPDKNLEDQLRFAEKIRKRIEKEEPTSPYDVMMLAELVLALDEWILNSGRLPERWRLKS